MLSRLTPTDVGTLCAFLTGREKCGLGLAEGLGQATIPAAFGRIPVMAASTPKRAANADHGHPEQHFSRSAAWASKLIEQNFLR